MRISAPGSKAKRGRPFSSGTPETTAARSEEQAHRPSPNTDPKLWNEFASRLKLELEHSAAELFLLGDQEIQRAVPRLDGDLQKLTMLAPRRFAANLRLVQFGSAAEEAKHSLVERPVFTLTRTNRPCPSRGYLDSLGPVSGWGAPAAEIDGRS